MPNETKQPFTEQLPRKSDDPSLVEQVLGPQEAAEMRELTNTPDLKGQNEAEVLPSELAMTDEEIAINKEKTESVRRRFVEWAKKINTDEEWVYETFIFNPNGTAIVEGDLVLRLNEDNSCFPEGLFEVQGDLSLAHGQIKYLGGMPKKVGGDLFLNNNQIDALYGFPKEVGGDIHLYQNQLNTPEGLPEVVNGSLVLSYNPITFLKGLPKKIKGDLWLMGISATGIQSSLDIFGKIYLHANQTELIADCRRNDYDVVIQ